MPHLWQSEREDDCRRASDRWSEIYSQVNYTDEVHVTRKLSRQCAITLPGMRRHADAIKVHPYSVWYLKPWLQVTVDSIDLAKSRKWAGYWIISYSLIMMAPLYGTKREYNGRIPWLGRLVKCEHGKEISHLHHYTGVIEWIDKRTNVRKGQSIPSTLFLIKLHVSLSINHWYISCILIFSKSERPPSLVLRCERVDEWAVQANRTEQLGR